MKRRVVLSALLTPLVGFAGSGGSHWRDGGGGIPRIRAGCLSGGHRERGIPSLVLPRSSTIYALPTSAEALAAGAFFQESQDVIAVGGCLVVQTAGRYRITANVDWPAQQGVGNGIRRVQVLRAGVGVEPPAYVPGALTHVKESNPYDRLAGQDWAANSADAWGPVNVPDEDLLVGEAIFITVRSEATTDWVQCCCKDSNGDLSGSGMTYLQLEKIA